MVAQGAHASLGAVLMIREVDEPQWNEWLREWLSDSFTKICVGVDSLEQLQEIGDSAMTAGLPVKHIVDLGQTEFGGVPTATCLAIGPAPRELIDAITDGLRLL